MDQNPPPDGGARSSDVGSQLVGRASGVSGAREPPTDRPTERAAHRAAKRAIGLFKQAHLDLFGRPKKASCPRGASARDASCAHWPAGEARARARQLLAPPSLSDSFKFSSLHSCGRLKVIGARSSADIYLFVRARSVEFEFIDRTNRAERKTKTPIGAPNWQRAADCAPERT